MKTYLLKHKSNPRLWLSWLIVIVIMIFVFNMSSQIANKSNDLSTQVTIKVVETAQKIIPQSVKDNKSINRYSIQQINHIIRKNAHFFIYCLLGFFLINAMKRSEFVRSKAVLYALSIGALYAVSDELHQHFVPGRGPQVKDVLLDSAGVAFGILLFVIIKRWKKNT